jgi:hypothetical protein
MDEKDILTTYEYLCRADQGVAEQRPHDECDEQTKLRGFERFHFIKSIGCRCFQCYKIP